MRDGLKRAGLRGQLLLYSLLIVVLAVGLAWGGTRYAIQRAFDTYRTEAVAGQAAATAEAAAELLQREAGPRPERGLRALARVTSTRIRWLDPAGAIRFDTGVSPGPSGGPRGPIGRWGPRWAAPLELVEGEAVAQTLPGSLGQVEVRPVGLRGVLQPRDVAFQQDVDRALLLAALVALLLAAAAARAGARVVGRPIERMGQAVQALPSRLPDPVPETGPREVRELARGINAMSRRIHLLERLRRESQGAVAHQLRTPLAASKGYLAAIPDGVVPPEEALEQMERAVAQLDRLAGELRRLNQAEQMELHLAPVPVRWEQFITELAESWRLAAEEAGVRLEVGPPAPATVEADPEAIAEAAGNLLENALRYTPRGGRVFLGGGADPASVWLEVVDTGPGIPPEEQPIIFERFYRGQGAGLDQQGTGIGLPIARQLVQAHGGTLELESEGGGSLFRIRLPQRFSPPEPGAAEKVRPGPSNPAPAGR